MMIRFIEKPRNFIRGYSLLQTKNSCQIEPPQILQIDFPNENQVYQEEQVPEDFDYPSAPSNQNEEDHDP